MSESPSQDSNPGQNPGSRMDYFATTRWTVVLTAGASDLPEARTALEELCKVYWYPLYAYVRRQAHSREDAEDLTQAFFARFLQKNYLEGLSSERGKFRAFLLASLKNFLANEWDRSQRLKRGGGQALLSLDWQDADARYQVEPADHLTPDRLYDRAWALSLLERVIHRLGEEHETSEKSGIFNELKPFLTISGSAIPYPEAAARLGVTEGNLRVLVYRLRGRYRELLREEICQTLADPALAEDEIRSLFAAVSTN